MRSSRNSTPKLTDGDGRGHGRHGSRAICYRKRVSSRRCQGWGCSRKDAGIPPRDSVGVPDWECRRGGCTNQRAARLDIGDSEDSTKRCAKGVGRSGGRGERRRHSNCIRKEKERGVVQECDRHETQPPNSPTAIVAEKAMSVAPSFTLKLYKVGPDAVDGAAPVRTHVVVVLDAEIDRVPGRVAGLPATTTTLHVKTPPAGPVGVYVPTGVAPNARDVEAVVVHDPALIVAAHG